MRSCNARALPICLCHRAFHRHRPCVVQLGVGRCGESRQRCVGPAAAAIAGDITQALRYEGTLCDGRRFRRLHACLGLRRPLTCPNSNPQPEQEVVSQVRHEALHRCCSRPSLGHRQCDPAVVLFLCLVFDRVALGLPQQPTRLALADAPDHKPCMHMTARLCSRRASTRGGVCVRSARGFVVALGSCSDLRVCAATCVTCNARCSAKMMSMDGGHRRSSMRRSRSGACRISLCDVSRSAACKSGA